MRIGPGHPTQSGARRALPIASAFFSLLLVGPSHATPLATTSNDFVLPGTQPLTVNDNFATPDICAACHASYGQPTVEPFRNWAGSMMAQSGRDPLMWAAHAIAEQDAPESGETCLRCHLPKGWLEGRSVPADGSAMTIGDRHGVQCSVCHRMVDPVSDPANPAEDAAILAALSEPVTTFGSAQMVVDPDDRRRGPFDVITDLGFDPHVPESETLISPFHTESAMCGTCHNLRNPAFTKNMGTGEYELNAVNTPGDPALGFPEQSTYDEWLNSEYATTGVYAPQFGFNVDVVSSCQDCHMPAVSGKAAQFGVTRDNVPRHSFLGGNTFIPAVLAEHPTFGAEVDAGLLAETVASNTEMLRKAVTVTGEITGGNLIVRVTNESGHKLPTGYPEGRRMWLHVRAVDADGQVVLESGRYVFETATVSGYGADPMDVDYDPNLHVWETIHTIGPDVALATGFPVGTQFHLVLNNVIEFDNRIPPRGFTNAAYDAFDGEPVGQAYADGEYWDDVTYPVGSSAVQAEVTLYYQTASREYVEFLRDENVTNAAGPILFDLWNDVDKSTPVEMARAFIETDGDAVNSCKRSVAKSASRYQKSYAKEWSGCYAVEAAGLLCDEDRRDEKVTKAEGGLRDSIGGTKDRRCAAVSLTPISIGHPAPCPVPCSTVTIFDMDDLASCAVCLAERLGDEALTAVYDTAPPALPPNAPFGAPAKCLKGVAKAAVKLAGSWTAALVRCEEQNAEGASLDCSMDPEGRIARAKTKLQKKLASCSTFAGLDGCLALGNAAAAQTCIEDAIGAVTPGLAAVGYP
jgi:hypothetical protein